MSDGESSEQLRDLAANPETPQVTIAQLAYEYPDLRATVAANPAAYDGLLEWLRQFDDPEINAALDARAGGAIDAAPSRLETASPRPTPAAILNDRAAIGWPRWSAFLSTRLAIILASILLLAIVGTVITLSVRSAAVSAQEAADQKATRATAEFDNAVTVCKNANSALGTALANAATTMTTDPSSLADPTLIDVLKSASAKNSTPHHCVPPAMAKDTYAIVAQTTSLRSASGGVSAAAISLLKAVDEVTASVQAKKDAATTAAAAATQAQVAAAAAAAQAQRTWHYASDDGHTFDLVLSAGSPETDDLWRYPPAGSASCGVSTSCKTAKLRDVCPDYDSSTMIAIPVTATFTATTQGFSTLIPIQLRTLTQGNYMGPNSNVENYLNDSVEVGHVWSSGPSCTVPASDNGGYSGETKTGASFTEKLVVILKKWISPNTPGGDRALLDWVAISPFPVTLNSGAHWQPDSTKLLTLSNNVIGG